MSETQKTNERPTHTFTTTNGHKIVLKDYITGREEDEIQRIFLSNMEMKQTVGGGAKGTENLQQEVSGISGETQLQAEYKTIEMVVFSVNGNTEDLLDAVLDLPSKDKKEVAEKTNQIVSPTEVDNNGENKTTENEKKR